MLKKMISFIKSKFVVNFPQKVISVLFAIILWFFVMDVENPAVTKTIRFIPIEYRNEMVLASKNLDLIDKKNEFLDIELRGNRNSLINLDKRNFSAYVDLIGAENGAVKLKIELDHTRNDFTILKISKNNLELHFDKITSSDFPVEINQIGELPENLVVESITPEIENITLTGPKRYLDSVSKVYAPLDLKNLKKSDIVESNIIYIDENNREILELSANKSIQRFDVKLNKEKIIKVQVQEIGELQDNVELKSYLVKPDYIKVMGSIEHIDAYNEVPKFIIDKSSLESSYRKMLDIKLPQGVKLIGDIPQLIVEVVKNIYKTIEISADNIEFRDLKDGLYAEILNKEKLKVNFYGRKELLEELKTSDINLVIDLKGLKSGIYDVDGLVVVNNFDSGIYLYDEKAKKLKDKYLISGIQIEIVEINQE